MVETGYAMGTTQSTRALFVVDRRDGEGVEGQRRGGSKKPTKASAGRQEWVTTVECVSAAGKALPALVVFKAQGSFNIRWLPDDHDRF